MQAKQLQVSQERNAPVSHTLPTREEHSELAPLPERWRARRAQPPTGGGTKATVNHQVRSSLFSKGKENLQFTRDQCTHRASQVALPVKNLPDNTGDKRNVGSTPGGHGGGHGSPLQYSGLGNPMDRRAWRDTSHRVAKSRTQLKRLKHTSSVLANLIKTSNHHQDSSKTDTTVCFPPNQLKYQVRYKLTATTKSSVRMPRYMSPCKTPA